MNSSILETLLDVSLGSSAAGSGTVAEYEQITIKSFYKKLVEMFREGNLTLSEYAEADKLHKNADKDGCWFSFSKYTDLRRNRTSWLGSNCITLDIDATNGLTGDDKLEGKEFSFSRDVIMQRLDGLCYILVPTHSYTDIVPRWRAFIFLAKSIVDSDSYSQIAKSLAKKLDGYVDPRSYTPEQLWYAPSCPKGEKVSRIGLIARVKGELYNCCEVNSLPVNITSDRNDRTTKNLIGQNKSTELYQHTDEHVSEFYSASNFVFPNGIPDRQSFYELGMSLAELVVRHQWPEIDARKVLDDICSKPQGADQSKNDVEWRSYIDGTYAKIKAGEPIRGYKTLYQEAKSLGWVCKSEALPAWLMSMNDNFFVAPFSSTVAIFRKNNDTWTPLNNDAFSLLLENKFESVETNEGTKNIAITPLWRKHPNRRQYDGVGFWPDRPAPKGSFNLWQGWPIPPVKGDASPALNHIHRLICNGDDALFKWVIQWCAHCVQKPNEQGHVALIVVGARGIGKTMFAEWMKAMFGRYSMTITNGNLLTGSFTGHLEKCVLMVAEEAFWAGDKAAENALKHVITGKTLTIHHKGFAPYDAPNYLHLMMTSNEDWVIPAGVDERRFCVCNVSSERKGDKPYFDALGNWEKNGGIAALLDYLLRYDIKTFEINKPPDTAGLREQKIMSMSSVQRWILYRLEIGGMTGIKWQVEESASLMVTNFCLHQHLNIHEERRAQTQLGMTLRKIFPNVTKGRPRTKNGMREQVYIFSETTISEAREAFEIYASLTGYNWGDDSP